MDGEKETIIMGAAEVICCFFLEEKIHNRPEISDHFHTHVPEVCVCGKTSKCIHTAK